MREGQREIRMLKRKREKGSTLQQMGIYGIIYHYNIKDSIVAGVIRERVPPLPLFKLLDR